MYQIGNNTAGVAEKVSNRTSNSMFDGGQYLLPLPF